MRKDRQEPACGQELTGREREREKITEIVKCPSCGADLRFDADTQRLVCDHCGGAVDFEKDFRIQEKDFFLDGSDTDTWSRADVTVYRCNNCGAKQVTERTDLALSCPFCGASNIIETEELPGIRPGAVFPFTVGRDACEQSVKQWLKKRKFVPTELKKYHDLTEIKGVYNPAWTFDSQTVTVYYGTLGEHYTVTVGSGKNRHTETRTRYFHISGTYDRFFDDVVVEASPQFDEKTFNQIRPFRKDTAVVYDKKYLAGFTANHYDKDVNAAFSEAKSTMENELEREILSQYHYDVVQSFTANTRHNRVTFKYVLLPVWVGHYRYKGKDYHYYVNGNTAKVVGKTPKSGWKIFRFILILLGIAAAAFGVLYLVNYFL